MPARRLHNRHTFGSDIPAKITGRYGTVPEIVFLQSLFQAHSDGLQVATRQTTVGRLALSEDEQVFLLLCQGIVVGAEEPTDVGQTVLLS